MSHQTCFDRYAGQPCDTPRPYEAWPAEAGAPFRVACTTVLTPDPIARVPPHYEQILLNFIYHRVIIIIIIIIIMVIIIVIIVYLLLFLLLIIIIAIIVITVNVFVITVT